MATLRYLEVITVAIMRWDPFGELLGMQREMDRVFKRLGTEAPGNSGSSVAWMPRIDVKLRGDDMVIHAEIPGLDMSDIEVEVTDNILTIKGERKSEAERDEEGWLIRERSWGSFERSLVLPEGVKSEDITADYSNGVLEVHVPKATAAIKPQTRKIQLGSGDNK